MYRLLEEMGRERREEMDRVARRHQLVAMARRARPAKPARSRSFSLRLPVFRAPAPAAD